MANIKTYITEKGGIIQLIKHNILMPTTSKKLLKQQPVTSVKKCPFNAGKTFIVKYTESVASFFFFSEGNSPHTKTKMGQQRLITLLLKV